MVHFSDDSSSVKASVQIELQTTECSCGLHSKIQFQQNSVSNSSFFILVMEVSGGEFLYDSGMCAPACLSSLGLSLQFSACEFRRKFCISGVFTVQDVCSAAGNGVVA